MYLCNLVFFVFLWIFHICTNGCWMCREYSIPIQILISYSQNSNFHLFPFYFFFFLLPRSDGSYLLFFFLTSNHKRKSSTIPFLGNLLLFFLFNSKLLTLSDFSCHLFNFPSFLFLFC